MIEMDKGRDVRRGASRFSRQIKQSGHKLFSGWSGSGGNDGGFVPLEKSKKERTKKLSAVNRASPSYEDNYEMGRQVSDGEEDSQTPSISSNGTCKRFKLPRKFFDNSNGVDHASVPRKLRSAMKKRSRESISPPFPDSKKLNRATGGVKSPKRDGVKKLKMNMKYGGSDWSHKQSECGPITKDEEEVVETLFALAGMFPDNEPNIKSKLDNASLDTPSVLPHDNESPLALEGSMSIKEDLNTICLLRTDESVDQASTLERSPEKNVKVNSLNELSVGKQPALPSSQKLHGEFTFSAAQVNKQTISDKTEEHKPSTSPVNLCVPSEPYKEIGKLKQPLKLETSPLDRKPEIGLGPTTAIRSQLDQLHSINESKRSGSALWPGLSSAVSSGACSHSHSLQFSASKFPAWLDTALCGTRLGSSTGKVSKVDTGRMPWKRCTAHVYISRLIQGLQTPDNKDSFSLHPGQQRSHEILKQGALTVNDFSCIRNSPNGVKSDCGIVDADGKNPNELRSGNLQHLRLHQDQQQAAMTSRVCASQTQSFNFLSLSAGVGAMEATSSSNEVGKGVELSSQLQVPYLHSRIHHPTHMPFPMSQTCYNSFGYADQPCVATLQQAHFQLPPFHGTSFSGPHPSTTTTALAKQQQQQQQQRLWAGLVANRYRTAESSTAMNQFPSWLNGRQGLPTVVPCPQAIISPSVPKYPRCLNSSNSSL